MIAQIPPTPTPVTMSNEGPLLEFPSVWELAPDAVQAWNSFGQGTAVIQVLLIGIIVACGIWVVYRFFKGISGEASET